MSKKEPYYYVLGREIRKRPVETFRGTKGVTMGFVVCVVDEFVDAQQVCDILNKGDPA